MMNKIAKWLSSENFLFDRISRDAIDVKFGGKIHVSIDGQIAKKIRIGVLLSFDPKTNNIEKMLSVVDKAYLSGLIVNQGDNAIAIYDLFEKSEIRKHDVLHTCFVVKNLFLNVVLDLKSIVAESDDGIANKKNDFYM